MTIFSPYPKDTTDPNYLGLSKEPERLRANTGLGTMLSGIGDMFEIGVKGIESIQKKGIEEEGTARLTSEQNAEIYRAEQTLKGLNGGGKALTATGPQGGMSDGSEMPFADAEKPRTGGFTVTPRASTPEDSNVPTSLPSDLSGGLNRLQRMGEANAAGKFTSTGMNMNAQAITSDLLQRYPGYAKEIRATAHSLGFGQTAYLTDLKTQINQVTARMDAKDTKDAAWEDKNRDTLSFLQPNYFDLPKEVRRSEQFRDNLQTQIGKFEARTTLNNDVLKELEVKHKKGEDIKEETARNATDQANTFLAATMTGNSNVMGFKNVNAIQATISDRLASGKGFTPEEEKNIGLALEQFKQAHAQRVLQWARTTKINDTTVAGIMGQDKLNELVKNSTLSIDMIQKGLNEKAYTIAGAAAMESQGMLDRAGLAISKRYPITTDMEVLGKKLGTPILQNIIQNSPNTTAALTAASNQILTGSMLSISLGKNNPDTNKPFTVNDIFNDYKKLGVNGDLKGANPNDAQAVMENVKKNILTVPPEIGVKFAKAAFTDDLFARVPAKEKLTFLVNYANPEMTAKVLELSKHDPELLNQYKSFIQNGVLAATQQTVSDYKTVQGSTSTAFNANPYFSMTFNPETNRIDLKTKSSEELYSELGTTPSRYGNIRTQLKTVQKTVNDLNAGLAIIDPVLKSEKNTISPEMIQLLNTAGVKVDIPDTTGSPAADTTEQPRSRRVSKRKGEAPISVAALNFAAEDLPPSGNVGSLDSFFKNPAGNVSPKAPVLAQGGNKKNINLTNEDLLSITTDDIPDGMSAKDFLTVLKNRRP